MILTHWPGFEWEAKVLASLNHPNIGHIYGLEDSEGQKALVLELVEGPTLADHIKQGPIPLESLTGSVVWVYQGPSNWLAGE